MYYNQSFDTSNRASLANHSKSFQGEITFGEDISQSQAVNESVQDISLNKLFQTNQTPNDEYNQIED